MNNKFKGRDFTGGIGILGLQYLVNWESTASIDKLRDINSELTLKSISILFLYMCKCVK